MANQNGCPFIFLGNLSFADTGMGVNLDNWLTVLCARCVVGVVSQHVVPAKPMRIPVLMPNTCGNMTNENDGHEYQNNQMRSDARSGRSRLEEVAVCCSAFEVVNASDLEWLPSVNFRTIS